MRHGDLIQLLYKAPLAIKDNYDWKTRIHIKKPLPSEMKFRWSITCIWRRWIVSNGGGFREREREGVGGSKRMNESVTRWCVREIWAWERRCTPYLRAYDSRPWELPWEWVGWGRSFLSWVHATISTPPLASVTGVCDFFGHRLSIHAWLKTKSRMGRPTHILVNKKYIYTWKLWL